MVPTIRQLQIVYLHYGRLMGSEVHFRDYVKLPIRREDFYKIMDDCSAFRNRLFSGDNHIAGVKFSPYSVRAHMQSSCASSDGELEMESSGRIQVECGRLENGNPAPIKEDRVSASSHCGEGANA